MFTIESTHSDRKISFTKNDGYSFWVELSGGIQAAIKVYAYDPHSVDLSHWFEFLGEQPIPWDEDYSWESLEGEFKIAATSDSLGHVFFKVSLRDLPGAYEESYIVVGLQSELGQLNKIAVGAREFFAK